MSRSEAGAAARTDSGGLSGFMFMIRGSRRGLLVISLLALAAAICETVMLAAIVQSIAALSSGASTVDVDLGPVSASREVTVALGMAVVAAVLRAAFTVGVSLLGPRVTSRARQRLRYRLFSAYMHADWETQSAEKTGRFLQVVNGSVNEASTVLALFTTTLPAFLTLTVLITVAVLINPFFTLGFVGFGLLIGLVLRPLSIRGRVEAQADARGRTSVASHVAGVLAAGAEVVVSGARQGVLDVGHRRISETEGHFKRANAYKRFVAMAGQSIAFIVASTGLLVVSLSDPDLDFAKVGTITVLLLRGAGLAQQILTMTSQVGTVGPFIEQVRRLIEQYASRRRRVGDRAFPDAFDIRASDVTYTYPGAGEPAVRVDDVTFAHGTSTAILGPSGSGKSTFIQLVLRLRDPQQGEITIGGVPATEISEAQFSRHVAYVPQAPHLIPATIRENIAFFRPGFDDADVESAARLAHLHDEVVAMEAGYDTVLDSHVDGLSGGQKQRLALARALITHPSVLVLDEPTSALDHVNRDKVLGTLAGMNGRTTVVLITHDRTTASWCDRVLALDGGSLRGVSDAGSASEAVAASADRHRTNGGT